MKRMAIFLGFISLLTACRQVKHDPRPLLLTRYDRELATYMQTTDTASEHDFLDRHHLFHALYLSEIIALSPDDPSAKTKLAQRLSQPDMRMLDQSVDSCYAETRDIETGLSQAFTRYKRLLPDDMLPTQLYGHVSGLQQQIVNVDTLLSISLDHYLGADFAPYRAIFNPYQLPRKSREYIVPDVVRVILYTRHPFVGDSPSTLLQELVYEGKIIYCLQQILPDTPIERLMGYPPKEMQWCRENESRMWNRLLQEKNLYATDRFLIGQYLSPAPFTAPFTQESPGQAGRYVGWRIVSEYMRQSRSDLPALWRENNALNILKTAKYRG